MTKTYKKMDFKIKIFKKVILKSCMTQRVNIVSSINFYKV